MNWPALIIYYFEGYISYLEEKGIQRKCCGRGDSQKQNVNGIEPCGNLQRRDEQPAKETQENPGRSGKVIWELREDL